MSVAARLRISGELADKIRRHGVETYPHECCGALLGRDIESGEEDTPKREIVGVHPLVNRREDSPQNRFSVSSGDVVEAEKAARANGLDVVGWYHSHPDHPARPSQYDREHAWPWYSYIIVSVDKGTARDMTSWRLEDDRGEFSAELIEIHQGARV